MELYKIVGTCYNDASVHQFIHIPENFTGVKIAQKFNWTPPIGYTSTATLETVKAILEDREWIVDLFDIYGLETDIILAISKLDITGTKYDALASFRIDFESYTKNDDNAEFPLKAISCLDDYNQMKNTAKNFTGVSQLTVPTTINYLNYVSLKKNEGKVSTNDDLTEDLTLQANQGYLTMVQNGASKIYNLDTALYDDDKNVYEFNRAAGTVDMSIVASGKLLVNYNWVGSEAYIYVELYQNDFSNPILTLGSQKVQYGSAIYVNINLLKTKLEGVSFNDKDVFFVGIEGSLPNFVLTGIFGNFSIDLNISTTTPVNEYGKKVPYLTAETVLNELFNNQIDIENSLKGIGITSSLSISNKLDYISIIPKDFLTDFCIGKGAMLNFKATGRAELITINTFLSDLLKKSNAIELIDFKELATSYDTTLNFASVTAGMDKKEYEVYPYFEQWHKILTFNQSSRNASEQLSLSMTKYRIDFAGIIDYVSKIGTNTASEMFLFDPALTPRTTDQGTIYDVFTPRDILENNRKLLEIFFYNYSKDTLMLSANGGDDFNLDVGGVHQFDDFAFTGNGTRIFPIKAEFKALMGSCDFSEKILTFNDGTNDLYIFVSTVETADSLEEQSITGNIIYFAP